MARRPCVSQFMPCYLHISVFRDKGSEKDDEVKLWGGGCVWVISSPRIARGRLKNPRDIDKWSSLRIVIQGNVGQSGRQAVSQVISNGTLSFVGKEVLCRM